MSSISYLGLGLRVKIHYIMQLNLDGFYICVLIALFFSFVCIYFIFFFFKNVVELYFYIISHLNEENEKQFQSITYFYSFICTFFFKQMYSIFYSNIKINHNKQKFTRI